MSQCGYNYEEASRWQGQIATDYLIRFYPTYVKGILTDTLDRVLGDPVRSSYFAAKRQHSNYLKRLEYSVSKNLALKPDSTLREIVRPITQRVNNIFKYLSDRGFLYAFNLTLILGAMIGLILHRTPIYWNLALIAILTLGINVSIGGDLPRYRIIILSFAGMFLFNYYDVFSRYLIKGFLGGFINS